MPELLDVLSEWDRLEAHMAARKLAVVAELYRRNPGNDGQPAGPGRMPEAYAEFIDDELASALAESRAAAGTLLDLARDLAVRLPATRPPVRARQCDFEHNTPYEAGGRTCLCNAGPKCRHDHRLKQHPKWTVDQLPDGTFCWTTPAGRTYTTEPTRYPI